MDWNDLLAAIALYLILEGLLPFLSPAKWRETIAMLATMSEQQLRIMGLVSMILGALLLAFIRG